MHLSAIAYNLKKYLKFIKKTGESKINSVFKAFCTIKWLLRLEISNLGLTKATVIL